VDLDEILSELDPAILDHHHLLLEVVLPAWRLKLSEELFGAEPFSLDDCYRTGLDLSGQSLPELGEVYETLLKNYFEIDDHVEQFHAAMTAIFSGWTGSAQLACSSYGGAVTDYVNGERDVLKVVAACLLSYGAIIHSARHDWVGLVDKYASACGQYEESEENKGLQVLFTALGTLFAAALGVVTADPAAVGDALAIGIAAIAGDAGAEAAKQTLGGDSLFEITQSYLNAAKELGQRVEDAIQSQVLDPLRQIADQRPVPPPPPLDARTFDQHPRSLVPPHVPAGVGRWIDTREAKTGQGGPSNISTRLEG